MPIGETVEVTLGQKRFLFFRQTVGPDAGGLRLAHPGTDLPARSPSRWAPADVQKLLGIAAAESGRRAADHRADEHQRVHARGARAGRPQRRAAA